MILQICDCAIVQNIVVGHGNRGAFFEILDFAIIALADFLAIKGALGSVGKSGVAGKLSAGGAIMGAGLILFANAYGFWSDDSQKG